MALSRIKATQLSDGSVTDAELQRINSVSSDVQTQINAKTTAIAANTTAIGNVDVTNHTNPFNMQHETTPADPAAGYDKLYFKNDNQLYKLDSAGNERIVGGDPEGIKTNAADIFTNFVKDMEVHGISALHTEAGFVDEMETAGDMVDGDNSSGITYTGTPGSDNADNYYSNTPGASDQTTSETYGTETDYKQQEWTKTNQGTSNVTIASSTDSNTKLLLNMNGSDDGTTFTDATGTHTVTAAGNAVTKTSDSGLSGTPVPFTAYGHAKLDASQKKIGTASLELDGDDYVEADDHDRWDITGQFTIDFWVRFRNDLGNGASGFCNHEDSSGDGWTCNVGSYVANQIGMSIYGNGQYKFVGPWDPAAQTWYHIAFTLSLIHI